MLSSACVCVCVRLCCVQAELDEQRRESERLRMSHEEKVALMKKFQEDKMNALKDNGRFHSQSVHVLDQGAYLFAACTKLFVTFRPCL